MFSEGALEGEDDGWLLGVDVGCTDGDPDKEGLHDGDSLGGSLGSIGQYSLDGSKPITCLLAQCISSV